MNLETAQYVVDIMSPNPVVISPETVAWSADHLAEQRGVHHLLVIDGYRLIGVVCCCDLRRAGVATPVGECMQHHPATIDDQETAEAAADRMEQRQVGCLPVLDWSGTLRGVVTRHDLRALGLLREQPIRACASCGSTHGLGLRAGSRELDSTNGEPVSFCQRCREQGESPLSTVDETYFTLGGGD